MTKLSLAAQAVLDAAEGVCMYRPDPEDTRLAAAAALRAAADQLTPYSVEEMYGAATARNKLLTIATELENQ